MESVLLKESTIEDAIQNKKIENIWHFTRLSNLDNILKQGLINRQYLEDKNIDSEFNDDYRYDAAKDAICCSIEHPNYKMFYRLRMNNPDVKWVVLSINPEVLWIKDCAFCFSNAACSEVTCIPIFLRKGFEAFSGLFEDIDGKPNRSELGIPDGYPTDPQAEILVFKHIKPKYITKVITQDIAMEIELKYRYPNLDFLYSETLFKPRNDWKYWQDKY